MKRRVEIARALIHNSRILFLDEPTVGLDAQSRERIWQYIDRLRSQRELTVLVTTHYIEEVEACDRVCIIDRGQVLALDTPDALKAAHGQQLLRVLPRDDATAAEIIAAYPRHHRPAQRRDHHANPAATPSPKRSCPATAAASAACRSKSQAWRACFCR